jgi:hypothetical protein
MDAYEHLYRLKTCCKSMICGNAEYLTGGSGGCLSYSPSMYLVLGLVVVN